MLVIAYNLVYSVLQQQQQQQQQFKKNTYMSRKSSEREVGNAETNKKKI